MSLMDKVLAKAESEPKVNPKPLLKPRLSIAAKTTENAATAPASAPSPLKKPALLLRKNANQMPQPSEAPVPAPEAAQGTQVDIVSEINSVNVEAAEAAPATSEVQVSAATSVEECLNVNDSAGTAQGTAATEENKTQAVGAETEVKKTPSRRKRQGGEGGKNAPSDAATAGQESEITVPSTDVTFEEAITAITSPFVDDEWQKFEEEVTIELNAIVVSDDMNPGTLKVTISRLSQLREKIWHPYQRAKSNLEILTSKEPEGLIERTKKVNLTGTNDLERKRSGVLAAMSFKDPQSGKNINLYEVMDEVRTRYNYLQTVMNSIQYKTNALITMNGALKLEDKHIAMGE